MDFNCNWPVEKNLSSGFNDIGCCRAMIPSSLHPVAAVASSSSLSLLSLLSVAEKRMDGSANVDVMECGSAPRLMMIVPCVTPVAAWTEVMMRETVASMVVSQQVVSGIIL